MLNLPPPNISHILELPHEILQKIVTDPSLTLSDSASMRAVSRLLRKAVDTTDTTELRNRVRRIISDNGEQIFYLIEGRVEERVFACGSNECGQLGFDTEGQPVTTPTLINRACFQGHAIANIISKRSSTFFQTTKGLVFASGDNAQGQLGLDTEIVEIKKPTLVNHACFQGHAIVKITSNGLCTFFHLADKRVFACGSNEYGQLGLDTQGQSVITPTLINHACFQGHAIEDITSNGFYTSFHLTDKRVLGCGSTKYRHQNLGTQGTPILIASAHPAWAVATAKQQLLDQRTSLRDLTSIPEPDVLNQKLSDTLSHVSLQKSPEAILNALKMIRDELRITTQELPALPDQALIEESTELATGESIKKIIPNPLIFSGLNKTFEIIQARSSQARPIIGNTIT